MAYNYGGVQLGRGWVRKATAASSHTVTNAIMVASRSPWCLCALTALLHPCVAASKSI